MADALHLSKLKRFTTAFHEMERSWSETETMRFYIVNGMGIQMTGIYSSRAYALVCPGAFSASFMDHKLRSLKHCTRGLYIPRYLDTYQVGTHLRYLGG